MARQLFDFRLRQPAILLKTLGLAAGVALLIGGGSAVAGTNTQGMTETNRLIALDPEPARVRIPDPQTNPEASDPDPETRTANGERFTCQSFNDQYTVMYHPQSQPGQAYAWATPTQLGGGWTPQLRCEEISRRLEAYRPDGLEELRTSVENNYDIICVTTQKNSDCRIVMTVPPGEDPELVRDRVFRNLTVADSGQNTQPVTTLVSNGQGDPLMEIVEWGRSVLGDEPSSSNYSGDIDLRPFLDRADGGTGARLVGGGAVQPNPRLNPENFRN